MQVFTRQIVEAMTDLIDQDLIIVRQNQFWVEVEIKSNILFSSGSANLEPAAIPLLKKIADILLRFPNFIQVEGLTDNAPINTMVYPSNWELSAARAASVVHLFTKLGIRPQRMMAVGYGEHRPVSDNSTPEGRQKNRRVVLVILAHTDLARMPSVWFGRRDGQRY
jgi:chemotaxis protein MotB